MGSFRPLPRRKWGVFASGLVLGPLIILILEILGLRRDGYSWPFCGSCSIPTFQPAEWPGISLAESSAPNTDAILNILLPFLLNPGVLFLGFVFISVLVPLIEETLKPIGVWFLAGQKITPAMGLGMAC